jgi:acyl-homoserine-lactone acylase
MKKLLFASIISVLVVSCGILTRQSGSRAEQKLYLRTIAPLSEEVVIRRTEYGIPHIYADNIKAAGYGLGWVQAEDYGQTITDQLLRARGEWSLYNEIDEGRLEDAISSDASNGRTYLRAVETWPLLETDTRDFLEGFAAGINMYIHLNQDEFDEWVQPFFTGYDVHARSIVTYNTAALRRFIEAHERQKSSFEYVMDATTGSVNTLRPTGPGVVASEPVATYAGGEGVASEPVAIYAGGERVASEPVAISPGGEGVASEPVATYAGGEGVASEPVAISPGGERLWTVPLDSYSEYEENPDDGSNAWALSPDRTKSGRAILLRNPHLSWTAGYYEAHLIVPGKLNFYGDFRAGYGLGIIGGFNERLGFATTNNNPDLDDVYSFRLDPDDRMRVVVGNNSFPVTSETVTVEYKTRKGTARDKREFFSLPWGQVILMDDTMAYIIRSAGNGEYRSGEQFLKMMMARNFEEWEDAMKMRAKVNSNLTYADADGNIYYVWNATIPDRPHEALPDTVAIHVEYIDQMWHEILPWEKLPMLKNPAGGYVRNENDPFHLTNLYEPLPPENYPSYFPEPRLRLRSQHSLELLHNDLRFSLEEIGVLKHSMRMILADRVKDDLIAAMEADMPEGEVAEALSMIREWDNSVAASSRGGLLFETWWDRYVATADSIRVPGSPASVGYAATPEKIFRKPWSYDEPMTTPSGLADFGRAVVSFKWAVSETARLYGSWNLPWGEVHRAVRGDVDVPLGGGGGLPGCFRVVNYTRHRSDRMKREANGGDGWIIAVEFSDIPKAYSVLAYGQSNCEDSPFYSDQIRNFAENRLTPVAFTFDDVKKQLISEYRPGKR